MTRAVLITGAARGIGRACATRFHAAGWFVGLYDIDGLACARAAAALGEGRTHSGTLDVTDAEHWRAALEDFWRAAGKRLDVLVNNAGILRSGPLAEIDLAGQQAMIDVNVRGVLNGCRLAFAYLRATPGSGVINLASASAMYGQPDLAVYSATKLAVRGLTEALDIEWRDHGVRAQAIWPLFVRTAMIDDLDRAASAHTMGVHLSPEDVARVVERAANVRGGRRVVHRPVGWLTHLMFHATRIAPLWLNRLIVRAIARR